MAFCLTADNATSSASCKDALTMSLLVVSDFGFAVHLIPGEDHLPLTDAASQNFNKLGMRAIEKVDSTALEGGGRSTLGGPNTTS